MENMIYLKEVIAQMEQLDSLGKRISFDLEVRTFNAHNKFGGGYRAYTNAKLLVGEKLKGKQFISESHFYRKYRVRKNPSHFDNYTRNIELENGMILKIKLRYIIKFNNKQVIY